MGIRTKAAELYRRIVVPSGFSAVDEDLGTGVFGLRKVTIAPLNGHIPTADNRVRDHRIVIYDGRLFESNDYNATMTWLQMARGDLVRKGIPCSDILRPGPAGALGFTAACGAAQVPLVQETLRRRNLFTYGVEVHHTGGPARPAPRVID